MACVLFLLFHAGWEKEGTQGGIPGVDGIPAEVFMSMPMVFVTPMFDAMSAFLAQRAIPTAWALGIMNPIPKDQGSVSIRTLLPICLQNVMFKWASAATLLMMEDIVAFASPPPPPTKPLGRVKRARHTERERARHTHTQRGPQSKRPERETERDPQSES